MDGDVNAMTRWVSSSNTAIVSIMLNMEVCLRDIEVGFVSFIINQFEVSKVSNDIVDPVYYDMSSLYRFLQFSIVAFLPLLNLSEKSAHQQRGCNYLTEMREKLSSDHIMFNAKNADKYTSQPSRFQTPSHRESHDFDREAILQPSPTVIYQ